MGPRLFSRGNMIPADTTREMTDPLQWGRDSSVAEIGASRHKIRLASDRFNGAATLQSRKSLPHNHPLAGVSGFNGAATLQSRK